MGINNQLQSLILSAIDKKNLTEEEIVKKLGYIPKKQHQALLRLKRVLRLADLGIVNTEKSGFDMKYSSAEFVEAICKAVALKATEYKPLIADLEKYADKFRHAKEPFIFADISFQQKATSKNQAWIRNKYAHIFCKSVCLLERDEQLAEVKKAIDLHYQKRKEEIPYEGVIKGYYVTLYYDDQEEKLYLKVPTES